MCIWSRNGKLEFRYIKIETKFVIKENDDLQ